MNKFLIVLLALWAGVAFALEGYINGKSWFGCADRDYFRKLVRYTVQGDKDAFVKAMAIGIQTGVCTIFKNGERVYITDTSLFRGEVKVRRPGQMIEYWTVMEAVKSR